MPPVKKDNDSSNRQKSIKDFFFIPKNRIPANDVIEEEIIVASPKPSHPRDNMRERGASKSPAKQKVMNLNRSPKSSQTSSALSSLRSTPTKQGTPVALRQKKTAVLSSQDAREDTPTIHTGSQSSQWRVMSAVEIPSPSPTRKQATPPSPTPPEPPAAAFKPAISQTKPIPTANGLTTSFSSISTLSSIPTSTASSSRRIIKNGLQAITNSDSGSADASSDEEELADIANFIPRKRLRLTPTPPSEREEERVDAVNMSRRQSARLSVDGSRRSSGVSATTSRREASSPVPKKAVYKHSLVNMVAQKEREKQAAARLEEMDAAFVEAERRREEERKQVGLAMAGLKDVVADDSDEGERMMLAMQRTEALEGEEEVFFFGGIREVGSGSRDFPADGVAGEKMWVQRLADEKWRTQACLTGFARELAEREGLPRSVQSWIANQLLLEEREDLREAYVEVLEVCQKEEELFGLDMSSLQDFYIMKLDPIAASQPSPTADPLARLPQVLQIIQHICPQMKESSIATTLFELILANTDCYAQKDTSSKCAIETCIESIIAQISPDQLEHISFLVDQEVTVSSWSTQLKCRAIAAIPALSASSHALRRRLALHLILDERPETPLTQPLYGEKILTRLKEAALFSVSDSTDYALLNALIQILDIALDAGFYPFTTDFCTLTHAPGKVPLKLQDPVSKAEAEKAFNVQIDALIAQLTLMASRIRDAGTTHLRRTQAKIALERLVRRLEWSVRIGIRRRKGVFGGDEEGAKDALRLWLDDGNRMSGAGAVEA